LSIGVGALDTITVGLSLITSLGDAVLSDVGSVGDEVLDGVIVIAKFDGLLIVGDSDSKGTDGTSDGTSDEGTVDPSFISDGETVGAGRKIGAIIGGAGRKIGAIIGVDNGDVVSGNLVGSIVFTIGDEVTIGEFDGVDVGCCCCSSISICCMTF
jgi:hypothetical protein